MLKFFKLIKSIFIEYDYCLICNKELVLISKIYDLSVYEYSTTHKCYNCNISITDLKSNYTSINYYNDGIYLGYSTKINNKFSHYLNLKKDKYTTYSKHIKYSGMLNNSQFIDLYNKHLRYNNLL